MNRSTLGTVVLAAAACAVCPSPARAQPARTLVAVDWEIDVPNVTDRLGAGFRANWVAMQAAQTADQLKEDEPMWEFAPPSDPTKHRLVFSVKPSSRINPVNQNLVLAVTYKCPGLLDGTIEQDILPKRHLLDSGGRDTLLDDLGPPKAADEIADRVRRAFFESDGKPKTDVLQMMKSYIPLANGAVVVALPPPSPLVLGHCALPHTFATFKNRQQLLHSDFTLCGSFVKGGTLTPDESVYARFSFTHAATQVQVVLEAPVSLNQAKIERVYWVRRYQTAPPAPAPAGMTIDR